VLEFWSAICPILIQSWTALQYSYFKSTPALRTPEKGVLEFWSAICPILIQSWTALQYSYFKNTPALHTPEKVVLDCWSAEFYSPSYDTEYLEI